MAEQQTTASRLNIAVLDDYQGISEPHFKELNPSSYEVTIFKDTLLPYNHPNTPDAAKEQLVKRLKPFTVICTMRERTPFPAGLIARLPNLKLLLTTGGANSALDIAALKERGIAVAGTSAVGTVSTTEHCVALILAAARNIVQDDLSVKSGGWQTAGAFSLAGKVFGTVGLGRLGSKVASIMVQAFGMRVIAWSSNLTQEAADKGATRLGLAVEDSGGEKTFRVVSKEELFKTADVISVHVVLSDRSRGLISSKDLSVMKPSAILVNTSRGPLVVEKDLLDTLENGQIRAAAIDVFDIEPLPLQSRWRTTKWGQGGRSRVLLTPHMGYVEEGALNSWYQQQIENIKRWQKGDPLAVPLS